MVQILQQGPSEYTLRQQAFNEGLKNALSGISTYQKEKTLRQEALEKKKIEADKVKAEQENKDITSMLALTDPLKSGIDPMYARQALEQLKTGKYTPQELTPATEAIPATEGTAAIPGTSQPYISEPVRSMADLRQMDERPLPKISLGNMRQQDEVRSAQVLGSQIPATPGAPAIPGQAATYRPSPLQTFSAARMQKIAEDKAKQGLTESQKNKIDTMLPLEQQKTQAEIAKIDADTSLTPERKALLKAQAINALSDKKKTSDLAPKERLAKMGAEAQGKVGAISSGLMALGEMEKEIKKGYRPKYINPNVLGAGAFISDDVFTKSQRVVSEVVGRLQSGGAISDDELRSFNNMGPRPADKKEIAAEKIKDQRRFLENKLVAFGFNDKDLREIGFNIGGESEKTTNQLATEKIEIGQVKKQNGNKFIYNGKDWELKK